MALPGVVPPWGAGMMEYWNVGAGGMGSLEDRGPLSEKEIFPRLSTYSYEASFCVHYSIIPSFHYSVEIQTPLWRSRYLSRWFA
jgi:hypothetical protein